MHLLCQQSDEIIFSHFVTTLNTMFESKLALEDAGYESSSENFNIPTPLRRTSKIYHDSSVENASFDQDPVTPHSTGTRGAHCRPIHRCLTYSFSEDDADSPNNDSIPPEPHRIDVFQQPSSKYTLSMYVTLEAKKEEEEDFPTVPLDDEHRDMEEILDRHLCIHEHSLPHRVCPYPCPYSEAYQASSYYDTLDLNDISEFEDLMTTSRDEDIPAHDVAY